MKEINYKKVINTLERINDSTKNMILQMAKSMSEIEVIRSFNQTSLDFFNLIANVSRREGHEQKLKLAAYGNLYQNAIKMNAKMLLITIL